MPEFMQLIIQEKQQWIFFINAIRIQFIHIIIIDDMNDTNLFIKIYLPLLHYLFQSMDNNNVQHLSITKYIPHIMIKKSDIMIAAKPPCHMYAKMTDRIN